MLFPVLLALLILPVSVIAQNTVINGKVTDPDGNPVPSVSVSVKGTKLGTTTKADGTYTLSVIKKGGEILVFTSVGFVDKEMPLGAGNEVNIQLEKSSQSMDAVVVVGYGTQKRKDVTGAVASLDKQRLENMPNSNLLQALEGAVPGVSINTNGGGAEGNNLSIIIRGQRSISGNRDVLIILDGIPYNGSISDINPSDVASVDILKDAAAMAIYGSRSANGVILITTKRGTGGKPTISYDGFYGMQSYANLPPILMGEDFYNFKVTREPASVTFSELANYNAKKFTNWLDLGTRRGQRTQHALSVRGGSNNFKYYASLTYLDVKGIALNDNFKRLSSRINLEANLTTWLTFGTNTQLSYNNRAGLSTTFAGDYGAYLFNPLTTPYDSSGKPTIYPWQEDTFFENPLAPTLAKSKDDTYKIFTTNYIQVKFPFVPGLSYKFNSGIEYQGRDIANYYGRNTRTGLLAGGKLTQSNSVTKNVTLENILAYDRTFGKHTIGFTGLYSYQEDVVTSNGLTAVGFPNDVLTFYQANVASLVTPTAALERRDLISKMGRLNYNFDSRYMLTITARHDAFSGFGAGKKYSFFPAAAVAWNIINESFMANSKAFSNLKLRLSYGANGNTAVSAYQTLAKLSTRTYVDGSATAAGYIPTSFANPQLGWETSKTFNLGLDFGFWKNRLTGTIDYYNTKTEDLLLNRSVSSVQGITTVTQNIGKTANQGFELGLAATIIKGKDFTWTANANLTISRNKIVDLYGNGLDDTLNQWFIGHPIDVNFGYVFDGVWQLTDDTLHTAQGVVKAGYAKVKDINKDGVINALDRTILGKNQPSFSWGMSNTFTYQNLSLYVFVYGVQGREQPNTLMSDNNVNSGVRYTTIKKNWWTKTNPTNDFYANVLNATQGRAVPILQNSSFVRIRDISLSYDFKGKVLAKSGLSKLRVYFQARNPFTITKWTGLDPEFTSQTAVPLQREFLVGLNVSL
jgi:TonB-linked SusC/RagA family outer membrane protein